MSLKNEEKYEFLDAFKELCLKYKMAFDVEHLRIISYEEDWHDFTLEEFVEYYMVY